MLNRHKIHTDEHSNYACSYSHTRIIGKLNYYLHAHGNSFAYRVVYILFHISYCFLHFIKSHWSGSSRKTKRMLNFVVTFIRVILSRCAKLQSVVQILIIQSNITNIDLPRFQYNYNVILFNMKYTLYNERSLYSVLY